MLAYTPKATVQAAIGGIPLALGLACGETVLADLLDGIAPLSELDAIADITAQALTEQLRSRIPAAEHTLSVIVPKTADVG